MRFTLEEALPLLQRTPAVLDTLLRGLPGPWIRNHEGEGTWSPYDIIGHLIHGERADWMPRLRRLLEHGTAKPFDRFDRLAQFRESEGKGFEKLLDTFARLRAENLAGLRSLNFSAADMAKPGLHPELGEVNLGQLLACWVAHDLSHLHQLSRVMAHQYDAEVGPWKQYLGVLHCKPLE